MDYGTNISNINFWLHKCDQATDIGAYLGELKPNEQDVFWRYLEKEIPAMETDRIFRKHFALNNCKPEDREALETETFKTEDHKLCELVYERWKAFKNTKSISKETGSNGGKQLGINRYQTFKKWVQQSGFDLKSYSDLSNEKLSIAMGNYKNNPFKVAPKTADRYRKKYLLETK